MRHGSRAVAVAKAGFIFLAQAFPGEFFFIFSESEHTRGWHAVFQIARNCDLDPVPAQ
jgi:hypothetical protein